MSCNSLQISHVKTTYVQITRGINITLTNDADVYDDPPQLRENNHNTGPIQLEKIEEIEMM